MATRKIMSVILLVSLSTHVYGNVIDGTADTRNIAHVIQDMYEFTCHEVCLATLSDACHVNKELVDEIAIHSPGPVCVECINKCLKRKWLKLPPTQEEIQRSEWSWLRFAGQNAQMAVCNSFVCNETTALEGKWNGLKCIGYEAWEKEQILISVPKTEPITEIGNEFKKIATLYQVVSDILKTMTVETCLNTTQEAHPNGYSAQRLKKCLDLRYISLVHYLSSMPGTSFHSALRARYALQYSTSDMDDCDKTDWLVI